LQILLLRDTTFLSEITGRCLREKINVEAALAGAIEKLTSLFTQLQDPFFRERAADLRDVGQRVLEILLRGRREGLSPNLPEGSIIVTGELLPSLTAQLNRTRVLGLIAEGGGLTAHAVILARSLGIPTLVNVSNAVAKIKTGDLLVVDGLAGRVIINPSKSI